DTLLSGFAQHFSTELQDQVAAQGLSIREAVILASIVQREAIDLGEAPLIASVYLNRLRTGMDLEADPTVQYALGFNASQQTWWTNPLTLADLSAPSPYNTYQWGGLPPGPISNPGLAAIEAVANATPSPYLYFNARCDGSGRHVFSQTFEEHLSNLCP
ncbi:MAG TPA: endolytic transglycosylase MltG, partial [Anaerolineales bacterium]|nr:endolytic transglycosylase MltG [Anaerolineales bacterium]